MCYFCENKLAQTMGDEKKVHIYFIRPINGRFLFQEINKKQLIGSNDSSEKRYG
jgi:hypothetical protein